MFTSTGPAVPRRAMARVRRGVLFVPGSDRAAPRGALESGPDTLVVDLRLGFAGKLLLHPDQVRLVHEVYAPSAGEIAHARRVVQAFDEAAAAGTGMFLLDGRMIDLPVVEAERAVPERARRAGIL
jgi:citrate lyase beta subunit